MTLRDIIVAKHSNDMEQLEFIFSEEKRIIVTAPAGCGKTTAMVSKIAWTLAEGKIPYNKKILAMTFSVNAATKIKDALNELLPELNGNNHVDKDKIDVANYHNFSLKILYKYGYLIHPQLKELETFKIVSDNSKLLEEFLNASEIDEIMAFQRAIQTLKYSEVESTIESYRRIFNNILFENRIITYNAILVFATDILKKKSIGNFYKQYYGMLIIDEFQDTNYLAFCLLKELIGDNKIVLLGDEIQKIYGFLGAINNIFVRFQAHYQMKQIEFKNNYRFHSNPQMKDFDKFIRHYANEYSRASNSASIKVKVLPVEGDENKFIIEGIKKLVSAESKKVAVLVRAANTAKTIVGDLEASNISYFNALFNDTDDEYEIFHNIALETFYEVTKGKNSATKSDLEKCLLEVTNKIGRVTLVVEKEYIFKSLFKLLRVLFNQMQYQYCSLVERYERINFILSNKSLRHMMEFIDDTTIVTTIHSAKGLEWDYVIIPRLMSYSFPSGCKSCRIEKGCNSAHTYCQFLFSSQMKEKFLEELSVFYVGVTRAKKQVFLTANNGLNQWGYPNKDSCFLSLPGLVREDFSWDEC